MSNIEKIKEKEAQQLAILQGITGMQEEYKTTLLFETGMEWVERFVLDPSKDVSVITSSSFFWGWWKIQWLNFERIFVDFIRFNNELEPYIIAEENGELVYYVGGKQLIILFEKFMRRNLLYVPINMRMLEKSFHIAMKNELANK